MKKRILVVENDITMRKAIRLILYKSNFDITDTGSAEKAIDFIENGNFDLIVTDLLLNSITGFDLYQKYKGESRFLIITGNTESELAQRSKRVLGYNFMEKPFTPEQLIEKTNLILHK